jgi:hypothetical protein
MTGGLWQFPKATLRHANQGVQDNRNMHIVISHAAAPGPRCRAASATLHLPHLQALLQRVAAKTLHAGRQESLTPLAEHVASGQAYGDGLVPWAAWLAQASALYEGGQHWALISPCHLQIHSDHVAMQDPGLLQLDEEESRTLLAAMRPYFEEDGIALHWHSASTWLAQGAVFQGLASASLARVRGQPIDSWIPRQSAAQGLRRLQNEMQMLLYTHALNDARSARGQAPVNGFWISGTGTPLATSAAPTFTASPSPAQFVPPSDPFGLISPHAMYVETLSASALRDDAQAWTQAWQALDTEVFAPLAAPPASGHAIRITFCGEQGARTCVLGRTSLWQRIKQLWSAPALTHFVHDL